MTSMIESRMKFSFDDSVEITKFDETNFYNKHFKKLQDSKGIDFIAITKKTNEFVMIEVKNFNGVEKEPDTKNRLKLNNPDSVILETALKIRDSIACIVGAQRCQQDSDLKTFIRILNSKSTIKVILLLEAASASEKYYKILTDDLKKKLAWLNVRVLVINKENLQKRFSWIHIVNTSSTINNN